MYFVFTIANNELLLKMQIYNNKNKITPNYNDDLINRTVSRVNI